jgi:hypothetical protein
MKALLTLLDKPFIVHLWDMLDNNHIDSEAFRWLIHNAAHVFCLTQEMIDHLAPLRADATILRFTRRSSLHVATAPIDGTLRIALIGNCRPYLEGLTVLNEAVKIVKRNNQKVSLLYIGTRKRVKAWGERLDDVNVSGYVDSDEQCDLLLSQCHIGFLPGPLASPEASTLSKFSIPSRILDYMATGLAITGTVHPQSATSTYMKTSGLEDCLGTNSPELLAQRLLQVSDPSTWRLYSGLSLNAFAKARKENGALNDWLENHRKLTSIELQEQTPQG